MVDTPVTPNHVTTARLTAGIAAAAAVAVDTDLWRNVGAGIFLLSMVLDRADGELARLSGKTSPGGHRYDLIADAVSNALIFVGLGIGLRDGPLGYWGVPLGLLAGAAIVVVLWQVIRIEAEKGARAGELKGVAGFDADDAMLAVPVAIWIGWSDQLLIAAAIGAPLFAVIFALVLLRRRVSSSGA